jgi:hypothetical protein
VQIFRIAREANTITPEQYQFLVWFESVYDFRTLMIPGPLVPIFQSLAYTSGPFEWIGNISPAITDEFRPVRDKAYSTDSNGVLHLPSIPLIIDQIQWFLSSFNITSGNENFIVDNFYSNLFGVPADTNSFGIYAMLSPNARFNVSVSTQQYRAFKSQANSFRFPPRLAASTQRTYVSWFEFFRFKSLGSNADTYQWFSTMSATMQRYCQFINSSVPMSAVSLTGLGATTPLWRYQPESNLREFPTLVEKQSFQDANNNEIVQFEQHFNTARPTTLRAIGYHFDPELEELAEQFSACSQVNASLTLSDGKAPAPPSASLRTGTAWILPLIRESPVVDVLPTHGPLIMTHYHSDTRHQ